MQKQKRAKVGGEAGPNGEFYKGGAFIATTQKPKAKPHKKAQFKQQYEPYKWDVNPEGKRAIFPLVGTVIRFDHATGKMEPFQPAFDAAKDGIPFGFSIETTRKLCDLYNSGERWADESLFYND